MYVKDSKFKQAKVVQSKVKVTSFSKLEILSFSTGISSTIYNWSWQLTTDS